MSNITKFKPKQLLCIEHYCSNPMLTQKDLSKLCDVHERTINAWMSSPDFIDAIYNRYMETSGIELPKVIQAMLREAQEGNVQAGRLILEHYGKLERKLKIEIDSPWDKFMKAENSEFIEVEAQDVAFNEVSDDSIELPKRNESNNKPRKRKKEEEERLIAKTQHFIKKEKEKSYQHSAYELRKRAKAVGLDLLPAGRHSKGVRKEWLLELERLEKESNNT